ncbi:MAG: hypothetical protein NTU97_00545 [Candidatus Magasanikbacteria bacterium]|nr:hypothetical protein [Candidatus Magasanikbacteria bacterium]
MTQATLLSIESFRLRFGVWFGGLNHFTKILLVVLFWVAIFGCIAIDSFSLLAVVALVGSGFSGLVLWSKPNSVPS